MYSLVKEYMQLCFFKESFIIRSLDTDFVYSTHLHKNIRCGNTKAADYITDCTVTMSYLLESFKYNSIWFYC